MKNKEKLAIVIFRHNLRTIDNAPLASATFEYDKVVGLFSNEICKEETMHNQYLLLTLEKLESLLLSKYGINLIRTVSFAQTLYELSLQYDIKLYFSHECGTYEKNHEKIFRSYPYKDFCTQTLLEPFEFDYTKSFSAFAKKAKKKEVPSLCPSPKKVDTVDFKSCDFKSGGFGYFAFGAGQDAGLQRLLEYMPFIHEYKQTRSLVDGKNISTMLSPYLSTGALSARMIYSRLKKQEQIQGKSSSSYWIYYELLWRDFFHFVMDLSENRLFCASGLREIQYHYKKDPSVMQDFFEGNTGVDIIDAGVLQLKTTGWLSNRSRQLLASYFCKNLGLNFLNGAAFFERYLIDYNPASNYGNFAYIGFVGNDSRYRVFDIIEQSNRYGGDRYIQKWLQRAPKVTQVQYHTMAQKVQKEVFGEI